MKQYEISNSDYATILFWVTTGGGYTLVQRDKFEGKDIKGIVMNKRAILNLYRVIGEQIRDESLTA